MKKRILSTLVLSTLGFLPVSHAQSFFGDWEGLSSIELFVSVGGTGNGLSPSTPLGSITAALNIAALSPLPVSVNIFPGTYSVASTNETFPLLMPARGLTLETYGPTGGVPVRAQIDGGSALQTILVNREFLNANPAVPMPPSVINALEIVDGVTEIEINPALTSPVPDDPISVEIRNCWIHKVDSLAGIGIDIRTEEDWVAFHVIEHNVIDAGSLQDSGGAGIREVNIGVSSTLIRCNCIFCWEFNILVMGQDSGTSRETRPRIFSNFIQLGETNVGLYNCAPFVTNNTIAFAITHTISPPQPTFGIDFNGPVMTLANNILWNPDFGVYTVTDLQAFGTVNQFTNHIYDVDPSDPGFVGGSAHPGLKCNPVDLHLLPSSQNIDAGTDGQVANLATPFTPYLEAPVSTMPTYNVRIDLGLDRNWESRVTEITLNSTSDVDIGGDEFQLNRIDLNVPSTTQDTWGNILPTQTSPTVDYQAVLDLSGPANGPYVLYLGFGFFDTVTHPTTMNVLPNTAIYQNLLLSPAGNLLLDVSPLGAIWVAGGNLDATGNAQVTIPLGSYAPMPAVQYYEAELYFQGVIGSATQTFMTNRLRIELNQ